MARSYARALGRCQRSEHELVVLGRLHVALDPLDLPVWSDEERGALDAHVGLAVVLLLDPDAVVLGGLVVGVAEQREPEAVLVGELAQRLGSVGRDAQYDSVRG